MNGHFFVLMLGSSGAEKNITKFQSFHETDDVVHMVNEWLEKVCGVDCVPASQEQALRAENGGKLPEMVFLCPEIQKPADLTRYNGFYDYPVGVFNLFLTSVYDRTSALRFRNGMIKEYGIDQDFSEQGDRMMLLLDTFVRSFEDENVDYREAEEAIYTFLMQDGYSLFDEGEASPDYIVVGNRSDPMGFGSMGGSFAF